MKVTWNNSNKFSKWFNNDEPLDQGCPTRGPRATMRPAWCLGVAHYSFSLQVVFFSKIVTISSKRVEHT